MESISKLLEEAWRARQIGNYEQACILLQKARKLCMPEDHKYLGRIFHIYAQFESDHDHPEKALEFCLKSVKHYQKSGNLNRIAHATRHLADIQRRLNHITASEANYKKALRYYEENNSTPGDYANAVRGFALLMEVQNKTMEAISAWNKVKEFYLICNLEVGVQEAQNRLKALQS